MRDGGTFGTHRIDRFNGGLFAEDAELESLHVPAKVFCAKGQGACGETTLKAHPCTLLYFSAAYNFGLNSGAGAKAIGLYTLGRIFEQSITYTALQFYQASAVAVVVRLAHNGGYGPSRSHRRADAELMALDAEITTVESEMNALVYRLYKLTADEIALVEDS